jgi:hypothetical protein
MRLEGLGKLKNPMASSETRDLPAYSIVPQSTTLPRGPHLISYYFSGISTRKFSTDNTKSTCPYDFSSVQINTRKEQMDERK